jgi:hypothetical protein
VCVPLLLCGCHAHASANRGSTRAHLEYRSHFPKSGPDYACRSSGAAEAYNVGLEDGRVFVGRWRTSRWGGWIAFGTPAGYGGVGGGRLWNNANLLVQFDGNGTVENYEVFPDKLLIAKLFHSCAAGSRCKSKRGVRNTSSLPLRRKSSHNSFGISRAVRSALSSLWVGRRPIGTHLWATDLESAGHSGGRFEFGRKPAFMGERSSLSKLRGCGIPGCLERIASSGRRTHLALFAEDPPDAAILRQRIDLILTSRNGIKSETIGRTGLTSASNGLWASDHTGVFGSFELRP